MSTKKFSKPTSEPVTNMINFSKKMFDHNDIECYEISYGKDFQIILSFVFKSDSPTRDAMKVIQDILTDYTKTAKATSTQFNVYIDASRINRPSYASLTGDFTSDLEKVTVGHVKTTVIIVGSVVQVVLKGALKSNKPKTPTFVFTDRMEAWKKITEEL